jgi:hypothetical protein
MGVGDIAIFPSIFYNGNRGVVPKRLSLIAFDKRYLFRNRAKE